MPSGRVAAVSSPGATASPAQGDRTVAGALELRPLVPGDTALYCGLYTDAVVMAHVGPVLAESTAREAVAIASRKHHAMPFGHRTWVMAEAAGGHGFGICGLVRRDRGAELGVLLKPAWWGRGHGVTATRWLVAHAFSIPGVDVVSVRHSPLNTRAGGMTRHLEQLGATPFAGDPARGWDLPRAAWEAATAHGNVHGEATGAPAERAQLR